VLGRRNRCARLPWVKRRGEIAAVTPDKGFSGIRRAICSHLGWGTIAVPSDEPGFVVASGELDECGSQLFDGVEGCHPQQVLFQGSDEALCERGR
jgi:hypothetical protein